MTRRHETTHPLPPADGKRVDIRRSDVRATPKAQSAERGGAVSTPPDHGAAWLHAEWFGGLVARHDEVRKSVTTPPAGLVRLKPQWRKLSARKAHIRSAVS